MKYQFLNPFGPNILKLKCPDYLLSGLNRYTESPASEKYRVSSDLLEREMDVRYLTESFCKSVGLTEFVEAAGELYMDLVPENISKLVLGVVPPVDTRFKASESIADVWINRYYSGSFTPIHVHSASLSGIIILKVPNKPGDLSFIHGNYLPWVKSEWCPDQEVGDVILFPSWLQHLVMPQSHDDERRTLSFNLIEPKVYSERKELF